ncbi:TetR/AcrR family transcriptional regulator [Actinomyces culturomici]|uniref:TetR/AcrR family transcriptional regulator n=1 Tax=Actinomyces culturomici TaxID=1926276 RepID=UPI00135B6D58|nr:TetR/AcrR family transcriptional regulator [Actinomyces culturomici]
MTEPSGASKRGPRADAEDLRGAILDAALEEFAERGFRAATVRRIAERADVAPRLIHYYFGSKAGLAREAMTRVFEESRLPEMLLSASSEGRSVGEEYVRAVLGIAEDPRRGPALISLMRAVGADEETREVVVSAIGGLIARAGGDLREAGVAGLGLPLFGSQILGLVFLRKIVALGPIADADPDELARLVGPTLDRYLALGRGESGDA